MKHLGDVKNINGWENVPGSLTSPNKEHWGEDYQTVIHEYSQGFASGWLFGVLYQLPQGLYQLLQGLYQLPQVLYQELYGKGTALWSSEIDKHVIAVAKYHFPDTGEDAQIKQKGGEKD